MQGERIGDYVVEARLGGGGMATVWRARHHILETAHALKVLDDRFRAMPQARKRFLDEARIQAQHLDHPNIVKVTNIVATERAAALVMELIDGPTLGDYIEQRRRVPSADEFRALALPILAAIQHAHDNGIIHRDLKPDNVLLATEHGALVPHVTDFGIAKVGDAAADALGKKGATEMDAAMGTADYMSPEQIRRATSVTERSDVFSLGALFYELATLRKAFEAPNDYDLKSKIVNGTFAPVREVAPGTDPAIAAAIEKALDPDPQQRFASCDEMAAAFGGAGGVAKVAAPARTTGTRSRTGAKWWWAVAVVLVGGMAAGVYVTTRGGSGSGRGGGGGDAMTARLDGVTVGVATDAGAGSGPDAAWSSDVFDMSRSMLMWYWPSAIEAYAEMSADDRRISRAFYERAVQRLIEERRTEVRSLMVRGQCAEARDHAEATIEELPQLRDEMKDVVIQCISPPLSLEIPYVVYFDDQSAALGAHHGPWLARIVELIEHGTGVVSITGYSELGEGDIQGLDLAKKRADTVRSYLIEKGIPANRLRVSSSAIMPSGEPAWRRRRVELRSDQ